MRSFNKMLLAAVFVVVCSGCSGGTNQGIPVPPVEDIESIAYEDFPEGTLVSERLGTESSRLSIDSNKICIPTASIRLYEFAEPVLFSEIQDFYNELGVSTGWEISNTRSQAQQEIGRHPTYVGLKEVNGRTHRFAVSARQPDGTGFYQVREDEPVIGFQLAYDIRPDPNHPFC